MSPQHYSRNPDDLSIAELTQAIKSSYGMTWQQMGEQVGRSEKMMRKLASGQSSGEKYRQSLSELYTSGQVRTLTPRARTKAGTLRPVRAKAGSTSKSVVPADTRGKVAAGRKRYRYATDTRNTSAGRFYSWSAPGNPKAPGHKKAEDHVKSTFTKIGRSQARSDKRVKVSVKMLDSQGKEHTFSVGSKSGFHASDALSDIRTQHAGSVEGWVRSNLDHVYPEGGPMQMVGGEIHEFDATRTKAERQAQDKAGTRRRWRR